MALKCIIIDDSLFIRQTVSSIIETAGHQMIASFESGPSFLNNMGNYSPDVVLCDIILPEMTGLDLLPMIIEGYPSASIIMLSGITQGEAISAALRLGAIDFLKKPLDKERVLLLLDKLASSLEPPSVEELSSIGAGCFLLTGFFEELVAHSSSVLRKVVEQQIRSILIDVKQKNEGMLDVDTVRSIVEPDPGIWGTYSEQDVFTQIAIIPDDISFELQFLYSDEVINNLYDQAIMTLGSKKRYAHLFEAVPPSQIGLPQLPQYKDPRLATVRKAGTTYHELNNAISVASFVFDVTGPDIMTRINPDLLTETDLMKNSIFYYALIGEDDDNFQEGLFGPLPVSSEEDIPLSSLAYTLKMNDYLGTPRTVIISIFFTSVADRIIADYNKLSFIIRTRLANTSQITDLDKSVMRGIVDDIIDYLLEN